MNLAGHRGSYWFAAVFMSGDGVADSYILTLLDLRQFTCQRQSDSLLINCCYLDNVMVAFLPDIDFAADVGQIGLTFGGADLQELLYTGEPLGDIIAGGDRASPVFGVQAQLSTWLTNTLSGNHPNRIVLGNQLSGGHIDTIRLTTDAPYRSA